MKYKSRTLSMKRARDEKYRRMYYFGYYLPIAEGMVIKQIQI